GIAGGDGVAGFRRLGFSGFGRLAGDTYWDLAKKAYGDATKWKLISEANKDFKPRRLPLGATLTIPPAAK
ncbi:MAG: LysM peptidoglycan-binding domain-containing protein, partial [Mesorhizobium sp.]